MNPLADTFKKIQQQKLLKKKKKKKKKMKLSVTDFLKPKNGLIF